MWPSLGLLETKVSLRHLKLIHKLAPGADHLGIERCKGLAKAFPHEGVKIAVHERAATFAAPANAKLA